MGESERLVKSLFDMARKTKPAVIFIDEIDSLMSSRSEGENEATRRIKTEFLVQMQGVGKDDEGILVLGATNIPWDLDPAVRRRFQKKIYISLPDETARYVMFTLNLGNDTPNCITEDELKEMAGLTEGYSGSDISTLTQDAIFEPIRRCQSARFFKKEEKWYVPCSPSDDGAFKMSLNQIPEPELLKPPDVCKDDFIKAMSKIKPTVSQFDLKKQEQFTLEFGQEG
jgi:vacuolar protein-sorting-associated protein 4